MLNFIVDVQEIGSLYRLRQIHVTASRCAVDTKIQLAKCLLDNKCGKMWSNLVHTCTELALFVALQILLIMLLIS